MKEELAMNNWLFKEGKAMGLEEGLAKGREEGELRSLVHLFERRLARTLSPDERATLGERLREQGAGRIWDMVLDLSPQELAAWLTTANGA
jgi:flagellar biosynthesis/type III secretory pathway protein FliH